MAITLSLGLSFSGAGVTTYRKTSAFPKPTSYTTKIRCIGWVFFFPSFNICMYMCVYTTLKWRFCVCVFVEERTQKEYWAPQVQVTLRDESSNNVFRRMLVLEKTLSVRFLKNKSVFEISEL